MNKERRDDPSKPAEFLGSAKEWHHQTCHPKFHPIGIFNFSSQEFWEAHRNFAKAEV